MEPQLNPAVCVHVFVENSHPEVTRLMAIEPDTTVGQLMLIVHAALGLEPSPPGIVHTEDNEYSLVDILDEPAVDALLDPNETVYYQPAVGNWDIGLMQLSHTELPQQLPALIDNMGPDLVSSIGDPILMRSMLEDIRQVIAGVPVPMPKIDLITATFPTLSLPQIHQRLTQSFPPAIAQRMAELSDADLPSPLEALTANTPLSEQLFMLGNGAHGFAEPEVDDEAMAEFYNLPQMREDYPLPRLSEEHRDLILGRLRMFIDEVLLQDNADKACHNHPVFKGMSLAIAPLAMELADMQWTDEMWKQPDVSVSWLWERAPYVDTDQFYGAAIALSHIDRGDAQSAVEIIQRYDLFDFPDTWTIFQIFGLTEGEGLDLNAAGHEFVSEMFRAIRERVGDIDLNDLFGEDLDDDDDFEDGDSFKAPF